MRRSGTTRARRCQHRLLGAERLRVADTEPDDIGNYTNRAPFPTIHLLREASVTRAVDAFPEAESIYERNIETLNRIGLDGWRALGLPDGRRRPG